MPTSPIWYSPTPAEVTWFEQTFKVKFKDYWSPLFGFDVTKFDELIKTPDGKSLNQVIKKKYGKEALEKLHRFNTLNETYKKKTE
jgi:hypothetical protein